MPDGKQPDPETADVHNDRGVALERLGRFAEALASYERAVELDPGDAVPCFNRGNALLALGRVDEALEHYDKAILLAPNHVNAHINRGSALLRLHRYDEALAAYTRAAAVKPDCADAFYNQGVALMDLGRQDEAIDRFDQAIALQPRHADAFTNRGNAFKTLGRLEEALASYTQAIALVDDNILARFNKAEVAMSLGDFAEGWPLYESRWAIDDVGLLQRTFSQPLWQGNEPIAGRVVLLHAEQGLGDTLQYCRYAPLLVARGAKVVLEVPRPLVRLLGDLAEGVTIVARGDPLPTFDLHCPLMSVPGRVGTTIQTIPAHVPYLAAEPARVACWRARLPAEGLRIGINWQGNPGGSIDRGRSAPLAEFAPLGRIPGVRLISLQTHHGLDQLAHLLPGMTVETLGDDFDSGPDAFLDAAAVIMSLDLVISTDTAIVHLAGALGRPVWVALKAVPHWTWMIDREDSPWYPSARLFRQASDGDWRGVFERMARELSVGSGHSMELQIAVSPGELIDRITILEIKRARIPDPRRLASVVRSHDALSKTLWERVPASPHLTALIGELKSVNETLWQAEVDLRDHERRQLFDARFVEIARSIYLSNDRRSALKRQIDELLGSAVGEEKFYGPSHGSSHGP